MRHQLRSRTIRRPRAVLAAAVGITTLLLAAPAAAGCSPLDELPAVGVPGAPPDLTWLTRSVEQK